MERSKLYVARSVLQRLTCGKECIAKVDTADYIWFCKDCWRSFIISEGVKKQNEFELRKYLQKPEILQLEKLSDSSAPPKPPISKPPPRPAKSSKIEPADELLDFCLEDLPDSDLFMS